MTVSEAFTGDHTHDRAFIVLGPTRDYYQQLIAQFRRTPDAKGLFDGIVTFAEKGVDRVMNYINELIHGESLTEPAEDTSAENNSSMILLFQVDGHKALFTGDAGVPALTAAVDYADSQGISLKDLNLLHVPHHGSKRNVGPAILDRVWAQEAFISASKEGAPKHPSKKVTNALYRRGMKVHVTQGRDVLKPYDSPGRAGWVSIEPLPFYELVED